MTDYFSQNRDPHALKEVCEFVSNTTVKKGAGRGLQDELLNGLLERVGEYRALNTGNGKFLREILHNLLETNIRIWLTKAKNKDDRLDDIDIKSMRGEAFQLLDRCIIKYAEREPDLRIGHFKTYAGRAFSHFGATYALHHKLEKRTYNFTDLEGDDSEDNPRRFVDTHANHRERSPSDRTALFELTEIVRELVKELPEEQRKIIEITLEKGKVGAIEHIKETKKSKAEQYYKRAIKMLERLMKEDPRFGAQEIALRD